MLDMKVGYPCSVQCLRDNLIHVHATGKKEQKIQRKKLITGFLQAIPIQSLLATGN